MKQNQVKLNQMVCSKVQKIVKLQLYNPQLKLLQIDKDQEDRQ